MIIVVPSCLKDADDARTRSDQQKSVWDLSDESSDEGFEIPLVTESQAEDYVTNESILGPETGLLKKDT